LVLVTQWMWWRASHGNWKCRSWSAWKLPEK
jgi:hypothetical protein